MVGIMTNEDLKIILAGGEDHKIEFKVNFDKSIVEEAVAFANASGGTILVGIDDKGKIVGTDVSNAARSRYQDLLHTIMPELICQIETFENIIVIDVPEGREKPYGCSRGFYLRVGPNSQKLNRNEIISFIQSEGRIRFDELIKTDASYPDNFNPKAYVRFLDLSHISADAFNKEAILQNLGCLSKGNDVKKFTNAGILFFADNPADYIPHSTVVCALYKGVEKVTIIDRKEFTRDIITNIEDVVVFLKQHLNLSYQITGLRRVELLEIPEVVLREAIVNAVCHRDYFEKGARVMVELFDDRLEISNPGSIPRCLDLKEFGKRSVTRNSFIASILHHANYIERMGTGIGRMRNAMRDAGLPDPEFEFGGFFTIILRRPRPDEVGLKVGISDGIKVGINETQKKIIELIENEPRITAARLAETIGISLRNTEAYIADLKQKGVLTREGANRSGMWKVNLENVKVGINIGTRVGISDGIKVGINETQKKILEIIESEPRATAPEIAERIGISTRKTEANIAALRDKGVLIREGSKKTGEWRIDLDKIKR